jgi:sec-independent protein translocase protein TatA
MPSLGTPELLIIMVIVLMLFGVGRLGKIGGELGSGIRAFRDGIKTPEEGAEKKPEEKSDTPSEADVQAEETSAESQENLKIK